MVEGLREGEWNWYHESGQVSATVLYKDGRIQEKQSLSNSPYIGERI
jgi:hypothetical protein